jgi:hypothetical protein
MRSPTHSVFMKKVLFFVVLWTLFSRIGVADEDPHWKVRFYQNPNAGGIWTKFDVSPNGTSAVPIDEFQKYGLQDQISEIRYTLPPGVFVVCFTGRFFKSADGDIAKFINNSQILKDAAGQVGIKFGQDTLALEGTGEERVVDLSVVDGGKYNKHIRSAKLVKP